MEAAITIDNNLGKEAKYKALISQIETYISSDDEFISTLANVSAILKEHLGFFWVGFYLVRNPEYLYLGPFQGPSACTSIKLGRGVCGTAWQQRATIIVPDVEKFPGHIACSSASRSEIVVPLISDVEVIGVLDIDSPKLSDFDEIDKKYLERLANSICKTTK